MTRLPSRTFTFNDDAKRERVPLIVGLTGPSSSGKTYSALRIAVGAQRVTGGRIAVVDTESRRALHYAGYFNFTHIPFDPPHGPLDYVAAFSECVRRGFQIIVADSMSHEHEGDGGVLDQSEAFLDEKAGNDWDKRNRMLMQSFIKPKRERKALNRFIVGHGDVIWILCYRAQDKIKPRTGKDPLHLGWQPVTTSDLPYEMVARYLLGPGSEGKPTLDPQEEAEKLSIKNPRQFQGWLKKGEQLSEDFGERLARWSREGVPPATPAKGAPPSTPHSPNGGAPTSPAAPAAAAGGGDPRIKQLSELRQQLGWSSAKAVDWLAEVFGMRDLRALTSAQLDDAVTLLDLYVNSGREAYDGERATLAGLGRVKSEG